MTSELFDTKKEALRAAKLRKDRFKIRAQKLAKSKERLDRDYAKELNRARKSIKVRKLSGKPKAFEVIGR